MKMKLFTAKEKD